ncbi:alternative ribosome rescue aminoacyl-tRNA hydrolase ArfB [Sphingobacterium oryzagri]|uniref:Alternative ribosome rescue aminoacyl-tRNA hydrolase ArfB n=1 Tax=Sphingobacterium oryzagri TaxID=3025669 RepID=A0ABY7WEU5_9SPHI|nr:alternative ribosome rescue aminoacyl-tRNA hydrolase ArfB [Sphingobacterium sp. KACC 22765]WDF68057.1 alternative ribosome rescue aminoacyl-tRNA hydrolase ArfB [Sphingobacterium sp. KACC 22765]
MAINHTLLLKEVTFGTSRSGGAGGQHVNKVESRVSLYWPIRSSKVCSLDEQQRLLDKLANRLNKEGVLQLDASDTRSQLTNKGLVIERFIHLVERALKQDKKRIATRIPKSQVLDRLDRKKKNAQKKSMRGKIDWD